MQMQSCRETGRRPGRKPPLHRPGQTRLETRAQRGETEIGGAECGGEGGGREDGVVGCNDHKETEADFPSSSWKMLPVSLPSVMMTVTRDNSSLLLLLTVGTHADTNMHAGEEDGTRTEMSERPGTEDILDARPTSTIGRLTSKSCF